MEPLLLYPDPAPPELAQALDLGGFPWKAVADEAAVDRSEPDDGWAGAVICADLDPEGAFALCRTIRKRDLPLEPVLLLVSGTQLSDLELRDDLFDDFCLSPFHPRELEARLKHLFWRTGRGTRPELIEYADLILNLETYQAAISGQPLDLTYMGIRAVEVPRLAPGQGVHARDTAQPSLGLRVLRRRPHGGRPRPPTASQARRGTRQPHPDGAVCRLPLRPIPLEPLTSLPLPPVSAFPQFRRQYLALSESH